MSSTAILIEAIGEASLSAADQAFATLLQLRNIDSKRPVKKITFVSEDALEIIRKEAMSAMRIAARSSISCGGQATR